MPDTNRDAVNGNATHRERWRWSLRYRPWRREVFGSRCARARYVVASGKRWYAMSYVEPAMFIAVPEWEDDNPGIR